MVKKERAYETTLQAMVFAALLFILLIPAFFGVYQAEEFVIMHLLSGIAIFLILMMVKGKVSFLATGLDYLLAALVLLYVVHLGSSYYFKLALEEVFKYLNYFLVFWLVSTFVKKSEIKKIIKVLFSIGLLTTFLAFLAYFDLIHLEGLVRGSRFYGTLKYCNALAAYLGAMVVLGYYLEQSGKSIYLGGIYFLTVGIFGTQSRLMWLIFIPGILLWGCFQRKALFKIVGITTLAFLSSLFIFGKYHWGIKVIVFLGGSLLSLGWNWLQKGQKKVSTVCGFVTILGLMVGGIKYWGLSEAAVFLQRFKSISLGASSARGRFLFYKDAWRVMQEGNYLGQGGGAWQIQFPRIRSSYYYTPEIHSQFWETGVEVGVLGLVVFAAVLGVVLFYMFKYRQDPLIWSLGGAFLFLYLHSLVDLDMALGFMALVAWTILGLFNRQIKDSGVWQKEVKIPKWALGCFLMVYLLVVGSWGISLGYSNRLGESSDYGVVVANLEQAIRFYPFDAQNYANLAAVHFQAYLQTGEEKYAQSALEKGRRARQKDPFNYNWYLLEAKFLLALDDCKGVLEILEQARPYLFKFENDIYAQTANLYRRVVEKGEPLALKEIIVLWERALAEMASVPEGVGSWAERIKLTNYEPFLVEVIYAYDALGEKEQARELFKKLSKQTIAEHEWLKDRF